MVIALSVDDTVTTLRLRRHGLQRHMRVFSHSAPVERLALYQMAKLLPPGARALEIGSHIGSSALFICAGLEHVGGHLVCVDTWMNQTMPDGEKDTFAVFKANTKAYANMITIVRKFSHELTLQDIGGPLDFVFIDGDHSENAVRNDFNLVAPHVRVGGLIVFHDLIPNFPGVHRVVGESLAIGNWQFSSSVRSLLALRKVQ
jgi:predicted O-methyltransferase YrrM